MFLSRPVRLIVPVAPAGAADITARVIAQKLTDAWGQPVIVDKSSKLRTLGVTTAKRIAELPDLPTIAESGLPGFEVIPWFGLFASVYAHLG